MEDTDSSKSGRQFALLYHLSQTFNSSLDLTEVLDRGMDEVVKAIKAERGFVALRDEIGELAFRSARGIDQTTIDNPEFQISRGVVEEVAKSGQEMRISDAQLDDCFRTRCSVQDLKLRSILCAPLKIKDNIIGVIYVDNRILAGVFTKDDLELLNAIAASAAISIKNARLFELAVEKGRMERFQKVIQDNIHTSAAEMMNAIETSVQEFIGDTLPYDDLTALILRRTGEAG